MRRGFFDSTKNMGIFSGRVKVVDPRFNLQSDNPSVYYKGTKPEPEKAIAEGNVDCARPTRCEWWTLRPALLVDPIKPLYS